MDKEEEEKFGEIRDRVVLRREGEERSKNQGNSKRTRRTGEISFDPIMPVLNAVHALLSSANVVTAIYQVTGQDLHGFKRRSNTFHGSALFTDTDRSITPTNKPIRLHLFDLRPRLFSLFLFF